MGADYKSSKEAFVSGMTGSSVMHINMISAVALSSIALHSALRSRLPASKSIHFPIEWLVLILPLLLSMTLFAGSPGLLSLFLLVPTGLLLIIPRREFGTFLPSNVSSRPSSPTQPNQSFASQSLPGSLIAPLPVLSTYRAHMMMMTVLSILAVDFPVFPRSLAKCETFGVSLMDLGVGSFVFSQGIVSAIPLLKDPSHLTAPITPKLISVLRKSFPIILLGLIRVLLVKGAEYPEHESEYGTHWNFFITLALLPVLQVFLHPFIIHMPVSLVGSLVALSHQLALSFLGLETYVLTAPRNNLLSANKEGLISLTGYMAIHLLGLSTGTLLLPSSPSYFRRQQQAHARTTRRKRSDAMSDSDNSDSESKDRPGFVVQRHNDKAAIELCSYAVVWWTSLGLSRLIGIDDGVSRRMANLPYILWVAAFNVTFLFGYLLLDLYFFPSPLSESVYSPTSKLKVPVDRTKVMQDQHFRLARHPGEGSGGAPTLLEAVNKNSLITFLLANVATGLINLSIPTMYINDFWAMVVLCGYAFGICTFAWTFRHRRIW